MKRKTFLRLTFIFPYLALALAIGISAVSGNIFDMSMSDNIFINVVMAFALSGIFWGPLYTWVAIVLLLWSIGKREKEIYRVYLLSPFILASSMGIPILFFNFSDASMLILWSILHSLHLDFSSHYLQPYFNSEYAIGLAVLLLMAGGVCIVIGYIFVGLMVLLDRALRKRNFLISETE